jgi:uncharacterized protein (TIGR02186 family)
MRARAAPVLMLLLLMLVAGPARAAEPSLITDLSQERIDINTTFRGADLLVFGAIQYPAGRVPESAPDIAIVLRGPAEPITVRRKEKLVGIWVNTDAVRFETVPGFYAVASTRPIDMLADDRTTAIYEIGVRNLQLSPASSASERITRAFEAGLIAARRRAGLFAEDSDGVQITGNVLYRARIAIPSAVPVGEYSAEIHLVRDKRVIASTTVPIRIEKSGFERWIYVMAQEQSLAYGLVAVLAALMAGWIASLVTRRV